MPERARNRRLNEIAMLQIAFMREMLVSFEETLKSSKQRVIDTAEAIECAKARMREEKDQLPNWMAMDQQAPVLRPGAMKHALEWRAHAGRVHDHRAKQLFLELAEEYERLAGKATVCKNIPANEENKSSRAKHNTSFERRIERFWFQSKNLDWSYSEFVVHLLEVLVILAHRESAKRAAALKSREERN
jgi:hypothetical protein